MLILAVDTSSAAGSAALARNGDVLIERAGDASRTHGERLPRELMALLDEARVTLPEIDLFAVATGPGSFTGLRIGIATMQGLALAQDKLVAPVSTFEALAFGLNAGADTFGLTAVWIDAHRGEVFAMLYGPGGALVHAATSLTPQATLDAWSADLASARRVVFAGDGAVKYRSAIEAGLGSAAGIPAGVPALAGAIARIAAGDPARAVRPHAVVPLYVRRPDAELARNLRQPADSR